jgi:methyl-accepting chemotaxis protein
MRYKAGRDERGQGAIMLVAVTLVLVVAVALLIRTTTLASEIDGKADNIARTGRGINTATDAILQLAKTNEHGTSILETSKPLVGTLDKIVAVAKSIDGLAASITGTALDVNGTAKGINGTATRIQGTARSINDGVATINRNVDTLIGLATKVKADTGNIVSLANLAHKTGACIDSGLPAGSSADGHCR